MSSIRTILRKDKIRSNGEAPLFLRITKDRKSKYKALGITLKPKHWDDKRELVKASYANSGRLNNLLRQKLNEANQALIELESSSEHFRGADILEKIEGKRIGFLEYSNRFVTRRASINSPGQVKRMKTVVRKVEEYLKGEDVPLAIVDVKWLYSYESHLRDKLGNSTNTVGANMSGLRSIINEAIREGEMTADSNPFDIYQIRHQQTDIEFLTEDELELFTNIPLKDGSRIEQHRDLYVFACFAAGIRIGDLLTMKWKNFNGERLSFVTRKTGDQLSIKLGDTAMSIIEKQSGRENLNGFIFGLLPDDLDLNDSVRVMKVMTSVNALINKNLKILAKRTAIDKNIHFHTSRHTWATRALRRGMRIEHVSKLLGHKSIKTTQKYAKIVNADLDEAMDNFFND